MRPDSGSGWFPKLVLTELLLTDRALADGGQSLLTLHCSSIRPDSGSGWFPKLVLTELLLAEANHCLLFTVAQ
jgi:hypothetical protein